MLATQGRADDSAVVLKGVDFSIDDRPILTNVDVAIPRGSVTAIMGPSGTGKTTLIRLMTGQLRPDRGEILVDGTSLVGLPKAELYRLRRRMGVLFQEGALFTDLNVFENVAFPVREHTDLPDKLIRLLVLMKLHAVGLRGAANLMPNQLSGGMARRVALARAVVMDPTIALYDEPFSGLDPISTGAVVHLVRRLTESLGMTSVVVTHDLASVDRVADRCYLLANGQIAAHGTPQDLRRSGSEIARQFVQGLPDGPVPFHFPAPDYFTELLDENSPT